MSRRFFRAFCLCFLIGTAVAVTSAIGEIPKAAPFSWVTAWALIVLISCATVLGFLAGHESAKDFT